jgi:hypothetical protein
MGMKAVQLILIADSTADGPALTNTTTGASIIEPNARQLIPGGFLGRIGQKLRLEAAGRISTVVTTPGTITFEFRLGPTANIIAATSPAFALNIVAKTNVTWRLVWDMEVRAVGITTSANLIHTGEWISEANVGAPLPAAGGATVGMIPASAPAVGTGFDCTVSNTSDFQADWSVANAANSIQCHTYALWALNMN